MENEILVRVENLSKKFCYDLKTSLLYGIQDVFVDVIGRKADTNLREKEFWALQNINFELKRGECLGLIGHNGAGKSTLLKVLNGLIKPDKGSVTYYGKMAALIELGAGFNPILTGRENVYINGQILGFSKSEMDEKFDEIVEFAELKEFIDAPVRNYSSGMKVRLGFAIAAQMEPDILLIDEVLAVGDAGFRVKCMNRITDLLKKCAVIFVSHSMQQVSKICTEAILMQNGSILFNGKDVAKSIQMYYEMFDTQKFNEHGNGKCKLASFNVLSGELISNAYHLPRLQKFHFSFVLDVDVAYKNILVSVSFIDIEMKLVAAANSVENNFVIGNNGAPIHLDLKIPNYLIEGKYAIELAVYEMFGQDAARQGDMILVVTKVATIFSIGSKNIFYTPVQLVGEWSVTN